MGDPKESTLACFFTSAAKWMPFNFATSSYQLPLRSSRLRKKNLSAALIVIITWSFWFHCF
jgi:hypothetical protein